MKYNHDGQIIYGNKNSILIHTTVDGIIVAKNKAITSCT
jgi:hypothetical protein